MTSKRANVELTDPAKAALVHISGWSGISQKLIAQRAFDWLADQPHDIQGAIIGALPQARRPDFAQLILRELTEARHDPPTVDADPARDAPSPPPAGAKRKTPRPKRRNKSA